MRRVGGSGRYRRAGWLVFAAGLMLLSLGPARDALAYTAAGDRIFVATGILPQIAPTRVFGDEPGGDQVGARSAVGGLIAEEPGDRERPPKADVEVAQPLAVIDPRRRGTFRRGEAILAAPVRPHSRTTPSVIRNSRGGRSPRGYLSSVSQFATPCSEPAPRRSTRNQRSSKWMARRSVIVFSNTAPTLLRRSGVPTPPLVSGKVQAQV
jgi:hypothetical protein